MLGSMIGDTQSEVLSCSHILLFRLIRLSQLTLSVREMGSEVSEYPREEMQFHPLRRTGCVCSLRTLQKGRAARVSPSQLKEQLDLPFFLDLLHQSVEGCEFRNKNRGSSFPPMPG